MIMYTENPIDSTKNPTHPNKWIWQSSRIQSQYSEIEGIFVYWQHNIRIRKQEKVPISIATRKIKYLGINLTKEVKDLYSENYTTLRKKIKENTNKWNHVPCSWIGRINIIKMSILPKAIYRFNTIPIKVPMTYFTDIEQTFQKFIWNYKQPWVARLMEQNRDPRNKLKSLWSINIWQGGRGLKWSKNSLFNKWCWKI